jgi:hypothetical protein
MCPGSPAEHMHTGYGTLRWPHFEGFLHFDMAPPLT